MCTYLLTPVLRYYHLSIYVAYLCYDQMVVYFYIYWRKCGLFLLIFLLSMIMILNYKWKLDIADGLK